MHEFSLAAELLTLIEDTARKNGARRVRSASLEIGELASVDGEALRFAFESQSAQTLAEGCVLDWRQVPLVVNCPTCGHTGPTDLLAVACGGCGGSPVRVVSGRGMRLVSIDVEDEADA